MVGDFLVQFRPQPLSPPAQTRTQSLMWRSAHGLDAVLRDYAALERLGGNLPSRVRIRFKAGHNTSTNNPKTGSLKHDMIRLSARALWS